jgi:hypothetical protein
MARTVEERDRHIDVYTTPDILVRSFSSASCGSGGCSHTCLFFDVEKGDSAPSRRIPDSRSDATIRPMRLDILEELGKSSVGVLRERE